MKQTIILLAGAMAVEAAAACNTAGNTNVPLLTSSSTEFTNATYRWNAYGAPRFASAAVPNTADEVAEIVKHARASNTPFLATGGRHAYGTTLSAMKTGLAIDLRKLNNVTIDKKSATMTVGGGAHIRDVITPVHNAGFQIGSGACSCPGHVGVTVGGGIGYLQGAFGLVIDALISAKMVTATGDHIEVSATKNPDLFWGIRGAGANFGIITEATYKLSQPINGGVVFHAELAYPADMHVQYFETLEKFRPNWPAELGFSTALFWDAKSGAPSILSSFIYAGTEAAARKAMKPFLDMNPAVAVAENIPFDKVPEGILTGVTEASCHTQETINSIHTVNVKDWSAKTYISVFEKFSDYLVKYPDAATANSAIIMEMFNPTGPMKVADDATAFPWRDAAGYIMLQMRWSGGVDNPFGETANNFARELRSDLAATSGYKDLSAYVNYAWGDESLEQIYRADKLPRLQALKAKWDPDNVFGFSNGLTTKAKKA